MNFNFFISSHRILCPEERNCGKDVPRDHRERGVKRLQELEVIEDYSKTQPLRNKLTIVKHLFLVFMIKAVHSKKLDHINMYLKWTCFVIPMLLDLLNILQTYAKCYIVIYRQRLFTIILYVC